MNTMALSHGAALFDRQLRHILRTPQKILAATVLPMAFVVLFGLLFGTVIDVPGGDYHEFIMAGIFVQMSMTAIPDSAVAMISDLRNGLVDRFRSLPMSQPAVLVARAAGDTVLRALSFTAMSLVGLAIGWRAHGGPLAILAGFAVLLLFGFTMSWVGALVGMTIGNAEAASSLSGLLIMPFVFLSSAFIPLDGLPGWLRVIAEWNPLSAVVNSCRDLWGNEPVRDGSVSFPAEHPLLMFFIWTVTILALVAPLAVRRYQTTAAT